MSRAYRRAFSAAASSPSMPGTFHPSARAAARDRVDPGHGEGPVGGGPDRIGGGLAAEEAGGVYRRQAWRRQGWCRQPRRRQPRAARGYFLDISQCPTATCGRPERSKVSTASAALHTTGSPCRLKEELSTAPTPVRRSNSLITAWDSGV